ncbi:MAG: hypothetical protein MUC94_10570 [bacterium]|jgi:hypothetical protein|nr:hypothetical protein [bacterium]
MPSKEIVWKIPEGLYNELERAQKELDYPNLISLVSQAVQRFLAEVKQDAWLKQFRQLQKMVRSSGGLGLGETKNEVIAKLREQRLQVFEEEYAHLYR